MSSAHVQASTSVSLGSQCRLPVCAGLQGNHEAEGSLGAALPRTVHVVNYPLPVGVRDLLIPHVFILSTCLLQELQAALDLKTGAHPPSLVQVRAVLR